MIVGSNVTRQGVSKVQREGMKFFKNIEEAVFVARVPRMSGPQQSRRKM